MGRPIARWTVLLALAFPVLLAVPGGAPGASRPSHPFRTAIFLSNTEASGPTARTAFRRVRAAGANVVKIAVLWSQIAPATREEGFDAGNHLDPGYNWTALDAKVQQAVANRLAPMITVFGAPEWSERTASTAHGNGNPNPADFRLFAKALVTHYSGVTPGIPRVRYWGVWNEPNLTPYMTPQVVNGRPYSPGWYRQIVNGFADAAHAVHDDNVVVAGELAPFRDITPSVTKQIRNWGPLTFMRSFLCLSTSLRPACNAKVRFDVWAHHPYTSGSPTHRAVLDDDVSLGDLPKMRRVLDAAIRARHIVAARPVEFWLTEFSWDSRPPDAEGVPTALLNRWVPEALYRAWLNGVTFFSWFTLRDQPRSSSFYQSGLYYGGKQLPLDRAKPYLQGFRFPFVAFPAARDVHVWGRTPSGVPATVSIQQRAGSRWLRLATMRSDRYGVFVGDVRGRGRGPLRAKIGAGATSLPFSLKAQPDRFFNPFGSPRLTG